MSSQHAIEKLSGALQSIWRFPAFCSSRWLTLGSAARIYMLGVLTGFPSLYKTMRVAGSVTDYNGAFADTLGPVENNLAVFVSIVGWLPESLMSALMEDSRV
eukprot:948562-Amphidinium_carterae.1